MNRCLIPILDKDAELLYDMLSNKLNVVLFGDFCEGLLHIKLQGARRKDSFLRKGIPLRHYIGEGCPLLSLYFSASVANFCLSFLYFAGVISAISQAFFKEQMPEATILSIMDIFSSCCPSVFP